MDLDAEYESQFEDECPDCLMPEEECECGVDDEAELDYRLSKLEDREFRDAV